MIREVAYAPRALIQLEELHAYIAEAAGEMRADGYLERIIAHCNALNTFSMRGTARPDIGDGLRTMGFERRITIVFTVTDEAAIILGVYYGGQNFERDFQS